MNIHGILAWLFLLPVVGASAGEAILTFEGTVSLIQDPDTVLDGQISVSSPIKGWVMYNTGLTDGDADVRWGLFNAAVLDAAIDMGNGAITLKPGSGAVDVVDVRNGFRGVDLDSVVIRRSVDAIVGTNTVPLEMSLTLVDKGGAVLTDDKVFVQSADVGSFDVARFRLYSASEGEQVSVVADLTVLDMLAGPQPGAPRSWEAGIPVSSYSVANAVNRNLITVIPIHGWSGAGPDIQFNLYHNSATVHSPLSLTQGMGFSLGPGWTTSYSAHLIGASTDPPSEGDTIIAVADDGTRDVYTYQFGAWQSPVGVFDKLEFKPGVPAFHLRHKDQSFYEFGVFITGGALVSRIVDEVGFNDLTITRNPDFSSGIIVLESITQNAGSGRTLFVDQEDGQLTQIRDPESGEDITALQQRDFYFEYDTSGRLEKITKPFEQPLTGPVINSEIEITYDSDGRIASITDEKKGAEAAQIYTYEYDLDAIKLVTDPDRPSASGLTQSFASVYVAGQDPYGRTAYTDRRDNDWTYEFGLLPGSTSPVTGALRSIENPLQERVTFTFSDNLLTAVRDHLDRGYDYTYDVRGNLLTADDPNNESRSQEWEYDDLNNLMQYTDPAGNETIYSYEEDDFPTLVTKITEPADGQGNPAADTTLDYYQSGGCPPGEPCGHPGQLKKVTDPNGVVTAFGYDGFGQLTLYAEGEISDGGTGTIPVYEEGYVVDERSRVVRNDWTCASSGVLAASGGGSGGMSYLLNNRPSGGGCLPALRAGGTSSSLPTGFPRPPCSPVVLPGMHADWTAQYDGFGRMTEQVQDLSHYGGPLSGANEKSYTRTHNSVYDELGDETIASVETDEYADSAGQVSRDFGYEYDRENGTVTRTGPDGVETYVEFDEAGRTVYIRRGPAGSPLMTAAYTYHSNGLMESITYGNGARVLYEYDDSNRIESIDHLDSQEEVVLTLFYHWSGDGRDLPVQVQEDDGSELATVDFDYDDRGRLIHERRCVGVDPCDAQYDLDYEYDNGGNRTRKINNLTDRTVEHFHDYDDPELYVSDNNRLVRSEETVTSTSALVSTTWYDYNCRGNPTRVVAKPEASTDYTAVRLDYAKNEQTVIYAAGESWEWDGNESHCPTNYQVSYVREFRYDSGRARYLNRELNVQYLLANPSVYAPTSSVWSEYDGDNIYGDFEVTTTPQFTITTTAMYEPGLWRSLGSSSPAAVYLHNDHLGTLRHTTGPNGLAIDPPGPRVFTAFGEGIAGPGYGSSTDPRDRYGYVGAYGYQTDPNTDADLLFPFLHLGARYYDPSTGRFPQRDPIGINGGVNVYSYVLNSPLRRIDPFGLYPWGNNWSTPACEGYCQDQYESEKVKGKFAAMGCHTDYRGCIANCGAANDDVGTSDLVPMPPTWDPWEGPTDDFAKPGTPPPPSPPPPSGGCGCTGIEGVPVLLVLLGKRRRHRYSNVQHS